MGCGDEKLSKYLTQTFTAHCNAMICQQVTLSGDAEGPKVADAVIEAGQSPPQQTHQPSFRKRQQTHHGVSPRQLSELFRPIVSERIAKRGTFHRITW